MEELYRNGYIGNISQLVTLRRVTLAEGRARGAQVIEVETAGGLALDVLADSGLDFGRCKFRGKNMAWISKNGYDAPTVFSPHENEFLHTFPGGLLHTCGLRNAGPACRDGDEWHPLHGRFHGLAAENVSAQIEEDEIVIRGVVRETALFGHLLEVKRTIRLPVFGASVTVSDTVTNLSPRDEEIMMIYHCNFGYPLLDENAVLSLPEARETVPRTPFAATGLHKALTFEKPVPGEEERVFFQKMARDFSASLFNPSLGVRMDMTWSGETLPILSEWRSMASGDYVLGLEPTDCYIMGRAAERKNGTLPVLRAFESVTHTVKIEFTEE